MSDEFQTSEENHSFNEIKNSDLGKFLMWNKMHNIIYYIVNTIQSISFLVFFSLQIISIIVQARLNYIGASEEVLIKAKYICPTISTMGFIMIVTVNLLTIWTKDKAIKGLDTFNDYIRIFEENLKSEIKEDLERGDD